MKIVGVDFTSAPTRRKPITVARGWVQGSVLTVAALDQLETLDAFEVMLREPGPWLGGFDLPFGLPRALVMELGWPVQWPALIMHFAQQSRASLREQFKAFCDRRPSGHKFAHRATDGPAGSSPSMKWVNPPVAWMLHAGAPRLLGAGVNIPGLHVTDASRTALEAYPGYVARSITRASYKSDTASKHTEARRAAREAIVDALETGACAALAVARPLAGDPTADLPPLRIAMANTLRARLIDDGSADLLDAVLCAAMAAHASRLPSHGIPVDVDPIEGWIAGVPQ
jgi:hypothetical protein